MMLARMESNRIRQHRSLIAYESDSAVFNHLHLISSCDYYKIIIIIYLIYSQVVFPLDDHEIISLVLA